MGQTTKEMRQKIAKSSNRKILRRQVELLAEYSRRAGYADRTPEASMAMVSVHKELIIAERIFFVRFLIVFFTILYLFKCLTVKCIQLIRI